MPRRRLLSSWKSCRCRAREREFTGLGPPVTAPRPRDATRHGLPRPGAPKAMATATRWRHCIRGSHCVRRYTFLVTTLSHLHHSPASQWCLPDSCDLAALLEQGQTRRYPACTEIQRLAVDCLSAASAPQTIKMAMLSLNEGGWSVEVASCRGRGAEKTALIEGEYARTPPLSPRIHDVEASRSMSPQSCESVNTRVPGRFSPCTHDTRSVRRSPSVSVAVGCSFAWVPGCGGSHGDMPRLDLEQVQVCGLQAVPCCPIPA